MSGLLFDLRFAFRSLFRAPAFAAVTIVTLALGIGANTAIFSFTNELLLRDLPVRAPEKLFWVGRDFRQGFWSNTFSYRYFELLRDQSQTFRDVAASSGAAAALTVGGRSDEIAVSLVSGRFFRTLGVQPALGRLLTPDDDRPEAPGTLVVSHSFWRSRFGADPSIVGAAVHLAGKPYRIVGVTAPDFHGTNVEYASYAWAPITHAPDLRGGTFDHFGLDTSWLQIIGRLAPGVAQAQATAEASTIFTRFGDEYTAVRPPDQRGRLRSDFREPNIRFEPLKAISAYQAKSYRSVLTMLAGAVGLLLLIACANVANLLLARSVRRRQELAVRAAAGASRARLLRQLLIEGGALAVLGGAVGIVVAWSLGGPILALMGERSVIDLHPDETVLGFALAVSMSSVLLFALMPAWTTSRINLAPSLKAAGVVGRGRFGFGSRGWFVAAQFALCLPLLVGAGLLIQSARNLYSQDVGFERAQRIQARIDPGGLGYDAERSTQLFAELLPAVAAQPGVESVACSSYGTLTQSGSHRSVYADFDGAERISMGLSEISEGYFKTLGVPLLRGRAFAPSDDASAPKVVVVNQKLAQEL